MHNWDLSLIFILLLAVGLACTNETQVADQSTSFLALEDLKRETFTFPPELKPLAKGLEDAGINIVYGGHRWWL